MTISARQARTIRRHSQRRSQNREGLGVSELFLASEEESVIILAATDLRLKYYLLGFARVPPQKIMA